MVDQRGETRMKAHRATPEADFAAYEQLPKVLRDAVKVANGPLSAISLLSILRKHGLEYTLASVANYNRRKADELVGIYAKHIRQSEFKSLDREFGL